MDTNNNRPSPFPIPPRSPNPAPVKQERSNSLFSNYKASKSGTHFPVSESSIRQVSESSSVPTSSAQVYQYRQSPGSSPNLSKSLENVSISSGITSNDPERFEPRNGSANSTAKRSNTKNRFGILRSRSMRTEDMLQPPTKSSTPPRLPSDTEPKHGKKHSDSNGSKTAPLDKDRSLRDKKSNASRNRSADRYGDSEEPERPGTRREKKDPFSFSSSFKENPGAAFLNNMRGNSTKVADGIGKAGKSFFGKLTRSGSSHEREPATAVEENYQCKVINLPLVEQTRVTRISKRLAASKDKTEFWMPALPWRCIDYLNMNGCEEEGLYRVPGSGKDVKYWQMRFDKEYDINLFDEPNLYDINIVGSMFKAWLRDLPDEIFPKATQHRIQEQCRDAKSTPQLLKDELSKLPPFNYYLLFAITCHISLLHSCSEKNKMDYRNLCICFQPCMKIEGFCFQFLILDWRNCWQGCWTEKEYLEREMQVLEPSSNPPPPSSHGTLASNSQMGDERAVSSGSSKPSTLNSSTPERTRPPADGSSSSTHEREDQNVLLARSKSFRHFLR
ncbi:uncharacterized protein K452DRAFT_326819 [Aplosporella prunicola CBS 121167]|uniref:Rho-GAP domain-containing protein n=1 Tax=Aplosporella prunicola CBS 121167 TaxID=1176127 RepID=A0A6A6BGS7_9PEZI|nr:uncharacterized protein K452DRAFT_326819 [Aplosporella prunicola CBS 121167]KAF2141741.1 hypothetical protein K452DRAFT_326819 [Aplosporella prunicola CBS 121167]